MGVWTTADPIGFLGGINLYQYVESNPVNSKDILGLESDGNSHSDDSDTGNYGDSANSASDDSEGFHNISGYMGEFPGQDYSPAISDESRAKVCCRPVPFVGVVGPTHCYTEDQQNGVKRTFGLIGDDHGGPASTSGIVHENNPFDAGGVCGSWSYENPNNNGTVSQCVENAATSYPNPSEYSFFTGPNSNTFASTVAKACGLDKPNAWSPGWGHDPAGSAK